MSYTKEQREAKKKAAVAVVEADTVETESKIKSEQPTLKAVNIQKKKFTLEDFPLLKVVNVRSNFKGTLIYVSKKTGYEVEWLEYGESNYMTIEELQVMRNTQRKFFENNWISLDDPDAEDILRFLQVDKYYEHAINVDELDDVFTWGVDRILEDIPQMASGTKESIAYRAIELIGSRDLDSIKTIEALEKAIGCELIEK